MSTLGQFIGDRIKSVQRGSITITSATSNTATISSVDTSKSVIAFLGGHLRNSTNYLGAGRVELTNATTVTAYAYSATDSQTAPYNTINYQVVEYY